MLIHPEPDFRENTRKFLRKHLQGIPGKVIVEGVGDEKEARERIEDQQERYNLIITHVHIPPDSEEFADTEKQQGLAFLKSIEQEGCGIPSILIVQSIREVIDDVEDLSRCRLIDESHPEEFEDKLLEKVKKSLSAVSGQVKDKGVAEEKIGKVDIYLNLSDKPSQYQMKGVGIDWDTPVNVLEFERDAMRKLIRRSKYIQKRPKWRDELRSIGSCLFKELCEKNSKLRGDFSKLIEKVNGEENVRIRFEADKSLSPVILEALLDIEHEDHWMLHAPIYHTVPVNSRAAPLFKDKRERKEPINCLIIAANAHGRVDDHFEWGELDLLESADVEADNILDYLKKNKTEFNIGKIRRIPNSERTVSLGKTFADQITEALEEEGPWHLVHFAGHSKCVKGEGYIFYPRENSAIAEDIDNFSRLLMKAKTRFIYLSSCESSQADFIFDLARKGIPSIVGFRWKIDDDKAAEYAQIFYENLFEKKKPLEYAFLETRKEMYRNYKDNQIWAAAMLIIQVRD